MNKLIIVKNLNDNIAYSCRVIPDFFGRLVDAYDIGNNRILKSNEIRIIGVNEIDSPTIDAESNSPSEIRNKYGGRDELGRFTRGNKLGKNSGGGRPKKEELVDLIEEVLESKHYRRKDGTYILAKELMAEAIVDRIIEEQDSKLISIILDRLYGKVRQDIGFAGAIVHANFTQEDIDRVNKIFKN